MAKHTAPQPKAQKVTKPKAPKPAAEPSRPPPPAPPSPSAASTTTDSATEYRETALELGEAALMRIMDTVAKSERGQAFTARDAYGEAVKARLGMAPGERGTESAGDWLLWVLGGNMRADELWEAMFNLADELDATAYTRHALGADEGLPARIVQRLEGIAERLRIVARLHHAALERMGMAPMGLASEGGAK